MKFHLFLLIAVCLVVNCHSQSSPCKTYPRLKNNYSPLNVNYHHYLISHVICRASANVTVDDVFNTMLSDVSLTAPTLYHAQVYNCGRVDLTMTDAIDYSIVQSLSNARYLTQWSTTFTTASIVTYIDKYAMSITNYTLEQHFLYDGKVTRSVRLVNGNIEIWSEGIGNNVSKEAWDINSCKDCMDLLWGRVDDRLKIAIQNKLNNLQTANSETQFIWNACFPNRNNFDISGRLILTNSKSQIQKVELSKTYSYSSQGLQKMIALFYTNDFTNGRKEDCHACAPTTSLARFVSKNNHWMLDQFEPKLDDRSGGFGLGNDISFVIKDGVYFMKEHYGDMHFGDISEGFYYFNLDTFEKKEEIVNH